jgi:hypothetical protein
VKDKMTSNVPFAREDDIVIKSLGDELLIYDLKRHKAHSLNKTAAWVWKHADGHTTAGEMSLQLGEELKTTVDEKVVLIALEQLQKAHLLKQISFWAPSSVNQSRRDAVRTLGIAGVLLPVITTIFAPLAEAAASCKPAGIRCTTNAECCSKVCNSSIGRCQ